MGSGNEPESEGGMGLFICAIAAICLIAYMLSQKG
jgi:hypothetical protein